MGEKTRFWEHKKQPYCNGFVHSRSTDVIRMQLNIVIASPINLGSATEIKRNPNKNWWEPGLQEETKCYQSRSTGNGTYCRSLLPQSSALEPRARSIPQKLFGKFCLETFKRVDGKEIERTFFDFLSVFDFRTGFNNLGTRYQQLMDDLKAHHFTWHFTSSSIWAQVPFIALGLSWIILKWLWQLTKMIADQGENCWMEKITEWQQSRKVQWTRKMSLKLIACQETPHQMSHSVRSWSVF